MHMYSDLCLLPCHWYKICTCNCTNNSEIRTSLPCILNIAVDSLRAPSLIFTKPMYLLSACGFSWQMSVVSVWMLTDIFLCVNEEGESETAQSMPGRHSFNFFFFLSQGLLCWIRWWFLNAGRILPQFFVLFTVWHRHDTRLCAPALLFSLPLS